jgi:hypothetical protein
VKRADQSRAMDNYIAFSLRLIAAEDMRGHCMLFRYFESNGFRTSSYECNREGSVNASGRTDTEFEIQGGQLVLPCRYPLFSNIIEAVIRQIGNQTSRYSLFKLRKLWLEEVNRCDMTIEDNARNMGLQSNSIRSDRFQTFSFIMGDVLASEYTNNHILRQNPVVDTRVSNRFLEKWDVNGRLVEYSRSIVDVKIKQRAPVQSIWGDELADDIDMLPVVLLFSCRSRAINYESHFLNMDYFKDGEFKEIEASVQIPAIFAQVKACLGVLPQGRGPFRQPEEKVKTSKAQHDQSSLLLKEAADIKLRFSSFSSTPRAVSRSFSGNEPLRRARISFVTVSELFTFRSPETAKSVSIVRRRDNRCMLRAVLKSTPD